MDSEQTHIFSLTFNFLEVFCNQLINLTNSTKNIETFLEEGVVLTKPYLKTILLTNELSHTFQNLKKLASSHLEKYPKEQSSHNKINLRYEKNEIKEKNTICNKNALIEKNAFINDKNVFNGINEKNVVVNEKNAIIQENDKIEDFSYNNTILSENNNNTSSLKKIKENFEIDASKRSNSNKLGLHFKSNKQEAQIETNLPNKTKIKQGSLNQNIDFEKMLDKKTMNQTPLNYRSSLDSNRLKNYAIGYLPSNDQEDCDPRFLDIIYLNGKKNECKNDNLNISENLTENMNETMSKLSPREERAIIKETLKKDYKCEFHQISDTKGIFPNKNY